MVSIITLDTLFNCVVPLTATSTDDTTLVRCGADVHLGDTLMYRYMAVDGCSYSIYDASDNCLSECHIPCASNNSTCGGGFTIDSTMSYVTFSTPVVLARSVSLTVADMISDIDSLVELHERLAEYCVDEQHIQGIVNVYLDSKARERAIMYPTGAIYLSAVEVDPATLFGGIWEPIIDVFPASVYAWTCTDDESSLIATADTAIVDVAICA